RTICRRTLTGLAAHIYAEQYGQAATCAGNIGVYDVFNGRAHLSGLLDLVVGDGIADANFRRDPVPADFRRGTHYFSVQFELEHAAGGALGGLVNNAGISLPGPLEFQPIEEFRRQLEVNVTAQLAVTQAVLSLLRAGSGRIVNITSIGGRVATPFIGGYSAS